MNTNDTHEKIFPADPLITAYVFGELEGDELARIEAAVQADPELQAAVEELRAFGGQLTAVLAEEPLAAKTAARRAVPTAEAPVPKRRAWVIPFPVYYLATAAAACFAILVWLRNESPAPAHLAMKRNARPQVVALEATPSPTAARSLRPAAPASLGKSQDADGITLSSNVTSYTAALAVDPLRSDSGLVQNAFNLTTKRDGRVSGEAWEMNAVATGSFAAPVVCLPVSSGSAQEAYAFQPDNDYRSVASEPLSTFSIDVDTASYANVRRFITGGTPPPRDAVRIEELVNYFPYAYAPPSGDVPFAAHLAVASAPWAPAHRLVRIALKGRQFAAGARPAANLVFLLDVSGSMNSANKLPLVKESLRLLVDRLGGDDRVAIVTYASGSGLALPSTPASRKRDIFEALDNLHAGGSTNGAMGIQLAYDVAKAHFVPSGINRVILCTDGDFNVGITSQGDLVKLIQDEAKSRVFLSVFGFGMGNYKDSTLELLADKGNGAYGYIDTRREAEKVFVEQAEGTLATIAKDVKIQVEFNPARVKSYRLIGYENRLLKKEDFNNDAVDAGEVGAGHTVTALYEIVPVGLNDDGAARPMVDALKYQQVESRSQKPASTDSPELLTVKIRYKDTEGDVSKKLEFPLIDTGADFSKADGEFHFAAAVAAWGMLLRDSAHKGSVTYDQVLNWAEDGLGDDAGGYRAEFIQLVRRSMELKDQ